MRNNTNHLSYLPLFYFVSFFFTYQSFNLYRERVTVLSIIKYIEVRICKIPLPVVVDDNGLNIKYSVFTRKKDSDKPS